jgi:hypothetical protein
MYLSVPGPPPPPPPPWYCKLLNLGCPAPQAQNPDSLASLYPGLQNEIATPGDVAGSTNSSTVQGLAGLGCAAGQPCKCGGKCKHGMGIFDSGTDISGWGWEEWSVVGVGAFAVWSMLSATQSGVRSVRRTVRRRAAYKRLKEAA